MENSTEQKPQSTNENHPAPKFISQRTLVLILALAGVTLFFLFLALRPQWNNKLTIQPAVSPTATPTPYAQSVLSLQQAQISGTPSPGTVTYNVNINSNVNTVNAVQLEMSFDQNVITSVVVNPGPFFPKPVVLIKKIDYKLGRISYWIGIQPTDFGVKGQGTIATLTLQYTPSTSPATTTLTFLPKSLVAAEGVTQSVLRDAQSATIPLNSPQGTSIPSQ